MQKDLRLRVQLTLAVLTIASSVAFGQTAQTAQPSVPAGVPRLVKFNGLLKDASGNLLANTVGITFSIYSEQTGGVPLWQETQNVQFSQGRYTVFLGETTSAGIPAELFASGQPRWLGVKPLLPGEEEQPRVLLASVPYALKAVDADTLGGLPPSAYLQANGGNPSTIVVAPATAGASGSGLKRPTSSDVTTDGTAMANEIPYFTTSTNIEGMPAMTYSGSNVQAAINAVNPSGTGGIVYIPPGTYVGPTSFPSNTNLVCLGSAVNGNVAGSFNGHAATAIVTQCHFTYTSTLTLSRIFNVHFSGISFDFQGNQAGLILNESQWNIFDDCSVTKAGYATGGIPAIQLFSQTAGYNVSHNLFRNLGIWVNSGAIGLQLLGSGTPGNGPAVTDNTFYNVTCTNAWLYCIDFELNTDTNFFYHVEGNEDNTPPSNSAFLAFNTLKPASDQDADNEMVFGSYVTGLPTYLISAGQGGGEVWISTASCPASQINILGGAPNINVHGVPFYGTPGCTMFANSIAVGSSGGNAATIHGVVYGSALLTFTAIGAGTCQEQDMTVTGAAGSGSAAFASSNNGLGNLQLSWSAWVGPANVVHVRVCNVSSGTITPNAVTWNAWVFQ
jgi:hypothetical protein